MSADLERGLADAFERLPRPAAEVTARARSAALATVPPRRGHAPRRLLVAVAVALCGAAVGAAALAAVGQLHVELGAPRRAQPERTRLTVPPETHGIALLAGGKLWLATRGGLRIEGMPASAVELSPRALYAVVGVGSSLVALAPGRRRAWTHPTPGPPIAAAWSPDGLKIAYVVRTGRRAQLHLIEGDGDHDRLLDPAVAAAKPIWRRDSLALRYVRATGRGSSYDLVRGTRTAARASAVGSGWARSPRGDEIAVAARIGAGRVELRLVRRRGTPAPNRVVARVRAARGPVTVSWR